MKKNIYFFNIAAAFILTAVMIIGCKPSTESPKPTPESCKITFSVDGEHGTLKAQVKDGNAINSGALIEKGKMIDFTAEPDTGYAVERWMLNGAAVNGTAVRYSLKVTQNATVKVIFKKKETPPSPLYTPIQYAQLKNYLENTANKPAADGVYYIEVTELTNENLEGSWEPNSLGKILKDCDKKVALKLSGTITAFSKGTFSGCTGLTSVTIPDGVIGIGESVFEGCTKLTEVKLPAKLTKIGSNTFSGCSSLTSITIPKSLTSIAAGTFENCSALTQVVFPENAALITIDKGAFGGCTSLTSITIPNNVTAISEWAFPGCTAAEITLPESITAIGNSAFGSDTSSCCKKVRIKDGANYDRIEKLVKDSGYPADRIEKY